jgi:hypothetical protein
MPKPFQAEYEGSIPFTRSKIALTLQVVIQLDAKSTAMRRVPYRVP